MTSTQSNNTILPVGKATAMIMALTPPGLAFWPATGVPLALKTLDRTKHHGTSYIQHRAQGHVQPEQDLQPSSSPVFGQDAYPLGINAHVLLSLCG